MAFLTGIVWVLYTLLKDVSQCVCYCVAHHWQHALDISWRRRYGEKIIGICSSCCCWIDVYGYDGECFLNHEVHGLPCR